MMTNFAKLSVVLGLLAGGLEAQSIPRNEYLRYLPLAHPRIGAQTPASVRFALYGDTLSRNYRDEDPRDGIDDARFRVLEALSVRFAPFMVRNTSNRPMDLRGLWHLRGTSVIHVDSWNLVPSPDRLEGTMTIDPMAAPTAPCQTGPFVPALSDDCRLLALLHEFDPLSPSDDRLRTRVNDNSRETFKVLFFDAPGEDPGSWKSAFDNPSTGDLRREYQSLTKIYSHPFLTEVVEGARLEVGYEFVLQYWFYYPYNDGGNNHEGDWEHINVVVGPRDRITDPLAAEDVQWILSGEALQAEGARELVIKRIEYYFHERVMPFDFSRPNVYQERSAWEAEIGAMTEERVGERWFWQEIRRRAYRDAEETQVNTHPIAYIGADNKGLDQLLVMPGGANRDSHGTFPVSALFKGVGPGISAEQIPQLFDYRRFFDEERRAGAAAREQAARVEFFDDAGKIDLIPDWERVRPIVYRDPEVRRDWSWLLLPIHWGYPASASPLAGAVEHANFGNIAVYGPAYNGGWNRTGAQGGFSLYEPNRIPAIFPTAVQDQYQNSLGVLNATLPTFINVPPFDVMWRILALPIRTLVKRQDPILYPNEALPSRFFALAGGVSVHHFERDFTRLLFQVEGGEGPQIFELDELISAIDPAGLLGSRLSQDETKVSDEFGWHIRLALYLGDHFSSENVVRNVGADVRTVFRLPTSPDPFIVNSNLNLWEVFGNLRYNVLTGSTRPFFKLGWGNTWYRLEDLEANGQPLVTRNAPWAHKPSVLDLIQPFTPNTFKFGAGIELVPVRNSAAPPRGLDIGLRIEVEGSVHKLGVSAFGTLPDDTVLNFLITDTDPTILRWALSAGLSVGF